MKLNSSTVIPFILTFFLSPYFFADEPPSEKNPHVTAEYKESQKKIDEIKKLIIEGKKSKKYDGESEFFEHQIKQFEDKLNSDKTLWDNSQLLKEMIRKGDPKINLMLNIIPKNLRYTVPDIPNNAYQDFVAYCQENKWPYLTQTQLDLIKKIEPYEKISIKELKDLQTILRKQEKFCLEALSILKEKTFLLVPPQPIFLYDKDLSQLRSMAKFLCNSALVKWRQGKFQSAVNRVKRAYTLGLALEKRQGSFIDILVAHAMKSIAIHRMVWIISQRNVHRAHILDLQSILKEENNSLGWKAAFKYELNFTAKMLLVSPLDEVWDMAAELSDEDYALAEKELKNIPDKDFKEEKIVIRRVINSSKSIYQEKNIAEKFLRYHTQIALLVLEDLKHEPGIKAQKALSLLKEIKLKKDNFYWDIMLSSTATSLIIIRKNSSQLNSHRALRLIIALRLYKMNGRGIPKNLDKLVKTGLLKKIPLNAWTGKPFEVDLIKKQIRYERSSKGSWVTVDF